MFGNGNLLADQSFGNIQTSKLVTGFYQITLLGYNPGCAGAPNPFLTATVVNLPAGFALANGGTGTDCITGDTSTYVSTTDIAGTSTDRDFTFALYLDDG